MKFMAFPNYSYLKLKMSGSIGTFTMGTMVRHAYECEVECCDLADGASAKQELLEMLLTMGEQAPNVKRVGMAFELMNYVKEVPLDPECADRRIVCIRSNLSLK